MSTQSLFELSGVARGGAILNATKLIVSQERKPTPAEINSICKDLPGWEACLPEECEAAMAMLDALADQHVAALTKEAGQPAGAAEQPADATAENSAVEAPAIDGPTALENLRLAHVALAECRANIIRLTNLRQAARADLATHIGHWQSGLPRKTKEQALREVNETTRMVRAQGGGNKYAGRPGPSRIDQERFFQGKGDANDFLRKQLARGHRRFARGDRMLPDGRIVRGE